MPKDDGETPLTTKIEQMLTEARIMLTGAGVAGFQFVATLTKSFTSFR
jgi:hypothetical protein